MTKFSTPIFIFFFTFFCVHHLDAQETMKLKLIIPDGAHVLVSSSVTNYDIQSRNGQLLLELSLDEMYELKVEKEGFVSQDIYLDTHYENRLSADVCQFTVHLYPTDEDEDEMLQPVNLLNLSEPLVNSSN